MNSYTLTIKRSFTQLKKKLRADMPIKQLEAETEAHAGKYACKPSMKVFFFSFFKEWIFIYLLAALQPVES